MDWWLDLKFEKSPFFRYNYFIMKFHKELVKMSEMGLGYRSFGTLVTAIQLGLFDSLSKKGQSLISLSRKTKLKPHYLETLLNTLVCLGFLKKKGQQYKNTDFSDNWLKSNSPYSIVNNLKYQGSLFPAYAKLAETVRHGRPQWGLDQLIQKDPHFLKNYFYGMVEISQQPSKELADIIDLTKVNKILDVGGGPGTFSLAMLKRNKNLTAAILDLPQTLNLTKKFLQSFPEFKRIHLVPGDYKKANFGMAKFDLILMSHVLHDEGPEENQLLIQKAHRALTPRGQIVIHDFLTNDNRTSPPFSVLFGIQMLVYTQRGCVYSRSDIYNWLKKSRFQKIQFRKVCDGLPSSTMCVRGEK